MEEGPDSYAGMPRIALLERAQEISSMEEISWAPSQEAQEISSMEEISWAPSQEAQEISAMEEISWAPSQYLCPWILDFLHAYNGILSGV